MSKASSAWFKFSALALLLVSLLVANQESMAHSWVWVVWAILGVKMLAASNQLIVVLLVLEFFMLTNFYVMILLSSVGGANLILLMMFFTFSVCEAALGLSLLVLYSRNYGESALSPLA